MKTVEKPIQEAINAVLSCQQFVGGSFVENFEKKLAAYLETPYVISCNSGTDALWLAIKALKIQKDNIILTTPFSFIASSSEIVPHDAHPVFIDVDPETLTIDPIKLEYWLTTNTVMHNGQAIHQRTGFAVAGIIAVDIFGQCANYTALSRIARQWGLWIIEDAAQSLGAEYNGKKAGTVGHIGCISFYPTKNLGAFGDAGCCVTSDPELAETLLRLRNHGRTSHYNYVEKGINSRLDGIQAAVLTAKLDYLDTWNNQRHAIAQRYTQELKNIPGITTPVERFGKHVYHQYCIVIDPQVSPLSRNDIEAQLTKMGVGTRIFYPKSLNEIAFLNTHPALAQACPISEQTTHNILALPMWPELADQEVTAVIEAIKMVIHPVTTAQHMETHTHAQ